MNHQLHLIVRNASMGASILIALHIIGVSIPTIYTSSLVQQAAAQVTSQPLPVTSADAANLMSPTTWAKIISDIGIMAALVLFFTITSWKREERLANRITSLETFAQQDLHQLVAATTKTIQDNTAALHSLTDALNSRPCIIESGYVNDQLDKLVRKHLSISGIQKPPHKPEPPAA